MDIFNKDNSPLMMIAREQNTHKLAEIWLACSLASHDFIDPAYWHSNLEAMRDTYLPSTLNLSFKDPGTGRVKGFISLRENHVEALFVDPANQGEGVGRALLDHAKTLRPGLTVSVYEKNDRAVRFYSRNGFLPVGTGIDTATGQGEVYMEFSPVETRKNG